MIKDIFTGEICRAFGFVPTTEQAAAIDVFGSFVTCRDDRSAMILRGSAGTGKTSLAGAMVRAMRALNRNVVLMAPTGRAAKVFSLNAGCPAHTIHHCIYRRKTYTGEDTPFSLNFNKHRYTLFIVDEASMISSGSGIQSIFGSGQLLDDLISFVYGGQQCRLMLIGDKAQLPPVGESESPALSPTVIEGYGISVFLSDLNEVLRQSAESGILWNATLIRSMITHDETTLLPRIVLNRFPDISRVPGDELIESLNTSYSRVGTDETIVVVRSNKRANIYNNGIRAMVLGREEALASGDLLMVVKNNYHWTKPSGDAADDEQEITFLANGDRMGVRRVRNVQSLYGFTFADALLVFPDYDNREISATVLLDTLQSEAPSLTREQSEQLFNAVMEDYADIKPKSERMKRLREDRFFNALQIKYSYAVTCHKAQGGQWAHVYIDQGYMTDEMLSPDYIHWLYTAFTRATEHLFLVNWPENQVLHSVPAPDGVAGMAETERGV
ncbi:MAG: AAA family ATPase [Prevotella sp.]|uniref:ATP-dependent DNA helicase n=1 Tax=Prevotella sp. TaxID=59823 RepID=UPI002A28BDF0|nr:AAA family ATPase [Prevotella sp.]MDD7317971.1 AAA family ATPase [Prevotellaceae bacterium]MDY4020409.1 AAA family ATPase [Prevotella sp.]